MNKNIIIILLALVCALLMLMNVCEAIDKPFEISNDTLITIKNKDSSETSKIELLQARNSELLLKLDTKDKSIRELQVEVKKYKNEIKNGGSVTVINTETNYTSTATSTVISYSKDSCDKEFRAQNTDTTWNKWSVIANKDSTQLKFKSKDKYSIVIGREKIGFMKYKPIVKVTTFNPFNSVKTLRAFEVKDTRPVQRFHLSLQGGYGFTLYGPSPYVGLGGSYTIW